MTLTTAQVPYTGPYSVEGIGKHRGNTAIALKRAMGRMGLFPWTPDKWDNVFNARLEAALDDWDKGYDGYAEGRYKKIRNARTATGEYALDEFAIKLIKDEWRLEHPAIPALGPIYNGGVSILKHDLTHATDGIDLYPAFDDAFMAGTSIIAPEDLVVTEGSSATVGDAFYALGRSKLRYWFGHLRIAPPVGSKFLKGQYMGRVAYQRVSHCHTGINVELLWGTGVQLQHHTDYTHGAPTVGAQMLAHLYV